MENSPCFTFFAISRMRETFMPPPVLPAQAPTNMSATRMNLENSGHRLKSTVENPVVVMMDATWKAA